MSAGKFYVISRKPDEKGVWKPEAIAGPMKSKEAWDQVHAWHNAGGSPGKESREVGFIGVDGQFEPLISTVYAPADSYFREAWERSPARRKLLDNIMLKCELLQEEILEEIRNGKSPPGVEPARP